MSAGTFFVDPSFFQRAGSFTLPPSLAHQVRSVLRLGMGDQITLCDGLGSGRVVTLTIVTRETVVGEGGEPYTITSEPVTQLTLYQGLIRSAKFEIVLQKGTEVGISRFVPLLCERSQAGLAEASTSKTERWQSIIREAAEQSGRGRLPVLSKPIAISAITKPSSEEILIVPWEELATADTTQRLLAQLEPYRSGAIRQVGIIIGPEGGLSREEVDHLRSVGGIPVSLGPRILRTETAGIVVASIVLAALGDI